MKRWMFEIFFARTVGSRTWWIVLERLEVPSGRHTFSSKWLKATIESNP